MRNYNPPKMTAEDFKKDAELTKNIDFTHEDHNEDEEETITLDSSYDFKNLTK